MPPLEAPLIGIDRHRLATDGEGITTLVAFHECPLRCIVLPFIRQRLTLI